MVCGWLFIGYKCIELYRSNTAKFNISRKGLKIPVARQNRAWHNKSTILLYIDYNNNEYTILTWVVYDERAETSDCNDSDGRCSKCEFEISAAVG
jgi:hypothetical protein